MRPKPTDGWSAGQEPGFGSPGAAWSGFAGWMICSMSRRFVPLHLGRQWPSCRARPDAREMMDGAVAVPDAQCVGGPQGVREVILRGPDRLLQRQPARQMGGDGGGERATGAVRVLRVYARRFETAHASLVEKHVFGARALKVPALDQDRAGALPVQRGRE